LFTLEVGPIEDELGKGLSGTNRKAIGRKGCVVAARWRG